MFVHFGMHGRHVRQCRRHDVAVDVAARSDGVEHRIVDRPDRRLELPLDDTVKLHSLPCREPDRAVRVFVCNFRKRQPLRGLENTPRNAGTNHETVRRLQALSLALAANVTVVLLVETVEFRQLRVVRIQRTCERVIQALDDRAAQVPAFRLDVFDVGEVRHQYTSRW